jgi:hypothetical protein
MADIVATAAKYLGPQGPPADFGQDGYEVVRITWDGAATGIVLTPPASLSVKTAIRVVGAGSNIPVAGVALNGVNTIHVTIPASQAAAGEFIDLLIFGRGR